MRKVAGGQSQRCSGDLYGFSDIPDVYMFQNYCGCLYLTSPAQQDTVANIVHLWRCGRSLAREPPANAQQAIMLLHANQPNPPDVHELKEKLCPSQCRKLNDWRCRPVK